MEEINLELERNSHKTFPFGNNNPTPAGINIVKEKKDVDIGLDLLINKSKVGDSPKPVEEFKPSAQDSIAQSRTPTPPMEISLDNSNSSGLSELKIDNDFISYCRGRDIVYYHI